MTASAKFPPASRRDRMKANSYRYRQERTFRQFSGGDMAVRLGHRPHPGELMGLAPSGSRTSRRAGPSPPGSPMARSPVPFPVHGEEDFANGRRIAAFSKFESTERSDCGRLGVGFELLAEGEGCRVGHDRHGRDPRPLGFVAQGMPVSWTLNSESPCGGRAARSRE